AEQALQKKLVESGEEAVRTNEHERQGKLVDAANSPQLSSAIAANAVQAGAPAAAGGAAVVPAAAAPPGVPSPFQPSPPSVAVPPGARTAAESACIVAEGGHVFGLASGAMEETKEGINEQWSNGRVPRGVDRIVKDAGQGECPPRPREKLIDALFELVKNMARIAFAPLEHAIRTVIFIVKVLYFVVALSIAFYIGYRYGHWDAKLELYITARDFVIENVGSVLLSYFTGGAVPVGAVDMAAVNILGASWVEASGGRMLQAIGYGPRAAS
ncbi:unnamed protein product, partial [Prorocentrum cordatum]